MGIGSKVPQAGILIADGWVEGWTGAGGGIGNTGPDQQSLKKRRAFAARKHEDRSLKWQSNLHRVRAL
jgi:hypothetical protein